MGTKHNPRRHPQAAAALELLKGVPAVSDIDATLKRGAKIQITFKIGGKSQVIFVGVGKDAPIGGGGVCTRLRTMFRAHGVELPA